MESQILELKWENHTSNMTSELQDLYINDALLDVTIVCGEFSLKAHKTVLSASSSFFRKLFTDNSCKHPILIMTDIDFKDLKNIVEFMYKGKVHISQDALTHFLKVAERLKIKGLSRIEEINLNLPERIISEMNDSCYFSGDTCEPITTLHSQQQNITPVESVHSNPRNLENCKQRDTNQQIPIVKVENAMPSLATDKLAYSKSNTCMHWQSECIDQISSNILPDCNLSDSSVSHKQSLSHQMSNLANSTLGESLNNEGFSHFESQANGKAQKQDQDNTGRNINLLNLHESQDQSPVTVPTTSTSSLFKALQSNVNSSQSDKTDGALLRNGEKTFIDLDTIIQSTGHNSEDMHSIQYATEYSCNFCQKSFATGISLDKHMQFHSELKTFACSICNYRFRFKSNLQRHLRIHTGEKPYECGVCHKRFLQSNQLRCHERLHTGEKPFKCRVCSKRFSDPSNLRHHEVKHTGEKIVECTVCKRQFLSRFALKCHQRIHAQEKR